MTESEKARAYDEALKKAKNVQETSDSNVLVDWMEYIFPELAESKDEKIRKALIEMVHDTTGDELWIDYAVHKEDALAWLEKQGGSVKWQKNTPDNKPVINHSVLMKTTQGIVEGYFVGSLWFQFRWSSNIKDSDVLAWMELSDLDEQGEQKPKDIYTFKSIPRLLEMIKPTDRAKRYCQKLIDSLLQEGYVTDAKIVSDCLKQMNGEKVAMATMDEQKPVDKVEPFDKYEGLTDFERTLADICIGWIGKELGWKQYIKDNADVLLKIAIKMFNSIQDAPFEQKSAAWSDEDEHRVEDTIYYLDTAKKHYASTIELDACIDWLKSLKDRIGG